MNEPVPFHSRVAMRWHDRRTYAADRVPSVGELASLRREQDLKISVVLPALNEAATIGPICRTIARSLMGRDGLVDELVVIDGGSTDKTSSVAHAAGASVVSLASVLPEIPSVGGKGESLWRSLAVTRGDIVVWIDADIRNFGPRFVSRLVGPLLLEPELEFVKGYYRRPLELDGQLVAGGGGRVTELTARPLLGALFPELSGFIQPLSGEYAGRRDVLERVPFFTGYGVEVGLLIDLMSEAGLDAMAQVDLDERVHRNRPLEELAPMAFVIAQTILRRAEERGRLKASIDYPSNPLMTPAQAGLDVRSISQVERPPVRLLERYVEALRTSVAATL